MHLELGVPIPYPRPFLNPFTARSSSRSGRSRRPIAPTQKNNNIRLNTPIGLQSQLSAILSRCASVKVNLDTFHALKTDRRKDGTGVDAGVLYLAPVEIRYVEVIYRRFGSSDIQEEGYIIENRPLTLKKSRREAAVAAPDDAVQVSESTTITITNTTTEPTTSPRPTPTLKDKDKFPSLSDLTTALPIDASTSPPLTSKIPRTPIPKPLKVTVGTYDVHTVELWRMVSYAPDGGYVREGVVRLGGV
ncbi:hypothetical protein BDQ17DRAFT_1428566 [Cyathus striatus]|nr:hypothetical protein BDQ17DRAFT_1428566 [Cyathus striatus]